MTQLLLAIISLDNAATVIYCDIMKVLYIILLIIPAICVFAQLTEEQLQVELIADELDVIWDIEATPDNKIFVLQRRGIINIIVDGQMEAEPYHVFSDGYVMSQGGLFDLCLDPLYASNGFVYISRTVSTREGISLRLSRFYDNGTGFEDEFILYDAKPDGFPKNFGGRIAIDLQNKLYLSIGDRGNPERAQDLSTLHGTILRLTLEGTVPPDNPFVYTPGVLKEIYSYGYRNPQGLAVQPLTGTLYATDHGPSGYDAPVGGDEINLVIAKTNYGWPIIYNEEKRRGMQHPLIVLSPPTSPTAAVFYDGEMFPEWRYNLLVANVHEMSIHRFTFNKDETIADYESLYTGRYGRIRAVAVANDGSILFGTSQGDYQGAEGVDRVFRVSRNNN